MEPPSNLIVYGTIEYQVYLILNRIYVATLINPLDSVGLMICLNTELVRTHSKRVQLDM